MVDTIAGGRLLKLQDPRILEAAVALRVMRLV